VVELVARLEGIPLALELAAARVRLMSVADINVRLRDRYKLLTGGGRGLLERQQTLRALVDWSYDLLNESERTVLNRLAVFVGGFDLEAAEQVWCRAIGTIWRADPQSLGGEVAGDARSARTWHALPDAGDDPRLRAREARAGR
jgi:predicted ATPase